MVESEAKEPTQIRISVELFGTARMACGQRLVEIDVPDEATSKEVVAILAETCPELIGKVILDDVTGLQKSYMFNLNGTEFISDDRLHLKTGDTLLLFSSQAGG